MVINREGRVLVKTRVNIIMSLSVLLAFALGIYSQQASAKTVHLESEPGFFLQAHFIEPSNNDRKIAVLVLHGFLTTNNFHTITSVMSALSDKGVAALAPNLSYGISARQTSMSCNSLHTHRLEDHRTEVGLWIDWLLDEGYENIVLLGHSSGSQYLVYTQATEPHTAVVQMILTSMFYFGGEDIGTKPRDLQMARHLMVTGNPRPSFFTLMFCEDDYFATPESYLSYVQLTRAQTLAYLETIKTPIDVIMGGEDEILQKISPGWLDQMALAGANVHFIPGANYFFSSLYEFDLQEKIMLIVQRLQDQLNSGLR